MTPLRVLIVEDDENDFVLVRSELGRGPHPVSPTRVETLADLSRALAHHEWDLMISDFSLRGFTAMEVLKTLAASGVDLPCIVISGTIEEELAVEALRAGARDFIVKDRMARLLPAITRELAEAEQRRSSRAAQVALDEVRERMYFAMEAAGVGTWESDLISGETRWSEILERIHGLPAGQFAGTFDAFIESIHPADRQSVREQIAAALRDRTESRLEYRVIWPDGSTRWVAGVGRSFYDDTGRPLRSAGIGMDITARKILEEQARQSQRMESIGNLAGGIAHDFNNILTGILGYSTFLLEDLAANGDRERMRRDVEEIHKAAERAATLTNQLLAFSRKQIIQPTVLNINSVVTNLEPMLRRLIGEDIRIVAHLSTALGMTRADGSQLEQVIMNLVVNARDAMPTGGQITIETASVDLDDAYAKGHLAVVPGRYVMMAVSDTGTGMSKDVQARIFEPFFTTKPKGVGTGLGLATSYGIVKQHNGYIWVYSEPGKGATFKVYLPQVEGIPDAAKRNADAGPGGAGETILLVEDDDRVRAIAKKVLKRNNYTVIEASAGDEALRVAAEHGLPIDLLLTDVVMPGMSGKVLADQLTARYPGLKVLFMSGYTDTAIVQHGVLTPDVVFLQKPFTPAAFARAVRQALTGR